MSDNQQSRQAVTKPMQHEHVAGHSHPPANAHPAPAIAQDGNGNGKAMRKRHVALIVFMILAVCGGGYGVKYYLHARQYEDTDDAFVDGSVVQVASRIAGQIVSVEVDDNQDLAAGAVLVRIDPRDFEVRLDQAKAAKHLAEAEAARRQADLQTYESLDSRTVSQQQLYTARALYQARRPACSRPMPPCARPNWTSPTQSSAPPPAAA